MTIRGHITSLLVVLCAGEILVYFTAFRYWDKQELSLKRPFVGQIDEFEKLRTCKIPKIYPFETNALGLIERELIRKKLKPPRCLKNPPLFVTDLNSTLIRVNESWDFWRNVTCCYVPYTASKPEAAYLRWINPKKCIPLRGNQIYIPEKYSNLHVKCADIKNASNFLYKDYFHFFRLDKSYEKKTKKLEAKTRKSKKDYLSVLYLGIDSVSLANFQRFLPKTRSYLVNEMGGVEFVGLNKVGRGTIENIVPTLSGCSYIHGRVENVQPNKSCNLVWKKFAKKGYRTVLSEETLWTIVYTYMRHDHRGKTSVQYMNRPFINGIRPSGRYAYGYGCFEHQFMPSHMKDRALEVAMKLSGRLYYHHMWSSLTTHDSIGFAKYLDDPFYELMSGLVDRKLLNNTVLVVSSDHGTVSSDYSRTAEGLIEARVPVLYLVFPDWFKQKYSIAMSNLRINSQGLSTPYDVHRTLEELLALDRFTNKKLKRSSVKNEKKGELGLNLFLPIPLNRTCESAHIPDEYCICWKWTQMDNPHKDITIIRAVSFTLDKINSVLDGHPSSCIRLDLEKIIDGKKRLDKKGNPVYEVTFQVIPSHGIFGAVLKTKKLPTGDLKFKVVGEIERRNKYGNQSGCLGKKHRDVGWLRSACFCRKLV